MGIVIALVAIVIGSVLALFLTRDDPKAKSLNEAVENFRETGPSALAAPEALQPAAGVYLATGEGEREPVVPAPVAARRKHHAGHGRAHCRRLLVGGG